MQGGSSLWVDQDCFSSHQSLLQKSEIAPFFDA